MFEEYYGSIQQRLRQQTPQNGFNIEDLFTTGEWQAIGDGQARQMFGRRFGRGVDKGDFLGVSRNEILVNRGGNEARYNYDSAQDEGAA